MKINLTNLYPISLKYTFNLLFAKSHRRFLYLGHRIHKVINNIISEVGYLQGPDRCDRPTSGDMQQVVGPAFHKHELWLKGAQSWTLERHMASNEVLSQIM